MTLNEFKAWLDGFSDAMGDAPTPEQWAKIKEKLAKVSVGSDLTEQLRKRAIPPKPWPEPLRYYSGRGPAIPPTNDFPWGLPILTCGDPPGSIGYGAVAAGKTQ